MSTRCVRADCILMLQCVCVCVFFYIHHYDTRLTQKICCVYVRLFDSTGQTYWILNTSKQLWSPCIVSIRRCFVWISKTNFFKVSSVYVNLWSENNISHTPFFVGKRPSHTLKNSHFVVLFEFSSNTNYCWVHMRIHIIELGSIWRVAKVE